MCVFLNVLFAFCCSETGGRGKKRDIDVFGLYFGVVLWVCFIKKITEIQVFIVFSMVFVATKQGYFFIFIKVSNF